jgi:hypothetical protein
MTYSRLGTGPVIGNDRKLSQADSELARAVQLYQRTYCPGKRSYSFPHSAQSHAEDRLAEQLRSQPRTSRVVTMVAQEVNSRGVPLLLVFVNAPPQTQTPPGIPSHFEGFRVVVISSSVLVTQRNLGSFWSDPIGTLVSGPGKLVDAAAGGPQLRRRAHAATAAAKATQAQIDAEKAARDAAVAASTAAAQQEVAATTAAAKAAAKKKLIKTLAIGGGAFAVLAVGLILVTGKSS